MRRTVAAKLEFEVTERTSFVLALAVAREVPATIEALTVSLDGAAIDPSELEDHHGTRMHLFDADSGTLRIDYAAEVIGRAPPAEVDRADLIRYLRPSRYVQSDTLTSFARETFGGLRGRDAVAAVPEWVFGQLRYDGEQSPPTGGAVETLETGAGVCRDFAHVTAALLRALDVPSRLVSVYAPQLHPMDFHAVVEALVDDRWVVVDSTRLAPRRGMVRIATGRDATDTAFETNTLADVTLLTLAVQATAGETLSEDPQEFVELG